MFWLPTFMKLILVRATPRAAITLAVVISVLLAAVPSGAQGLRNSAGMYSLPAFEFLAEDPTFDPMGSEPLFAPDPSTILLRGPTRGTEPPARRHSGSGSRPNILTGLRVMESDRISFTSGLLLTSEANEFVRRSAFDFVLPVPVGSGRTLLFEARSEVENPFRGGFRNPDARLDMSLGSGYRVESGNHSWVGANFFFDASRIEGEWYSALGLGFETEFMIGEASGIDVSFNRYQGGGLDLEVGLNVALVKDAADLRISAAKYRFFDGDFLLGWRAGIDLANSKKTYGAKYVFSQDGRNGNCHTVGLYASLSFRIEDLLTGKNPSGSPRGEAPVIRTSESRLADGSKRMWRQPRTVVVARKTPQGKQWGMPGKVRYEADFDANVDSFFKLDHPICIFCCDSDKREKRCCKDPDEKEPISLGSWIAGAIYAGVYRGCDHSYRFLFGPYTLATEESKD